jgi:hypothetical protein
LPLNVNITLQYATANIPGLGIVPAAVHAARSRAGKAMTFHVHLDTGPHYSLLPIDQIFHSDGDRFKLGDIQPWSCFSDEVEYFVFERFRFGRVRVLPLNIQARYIGTFDWLNNDFSDMIEEFKQGHFLALENGQYGIFPNNMLLFEDKAWTGKEIKVPGKIARNLRYPNSEWE